jgi:PAS domain S-box-containing protein
MVLFDMRTIIFSLVLTYVVSTLVVFILWVQYHNRYSGTAHLVINFALQTIGLLLIVLREMIPDWISVDIANTIIIAGIVIGYMGLEAYTGIKSRQILNFILVVVFAFFHTWFTFFNPDLALRNLNISVVSFIIFIQCAYLMLYKVQRRKLGLTHSVGLAYVGFSLLCIANIIRFIFGTGERTNDYFDSGSFDTIVTIVYQMLVILLTYSLVLMFSKNLLKDIKSEEEKFSTAFNTSTTAIIITRFKDGLITEANKGFLNITGYGYSDVVGNSASDLYLWENEDERTATFKELSVTGKVHEKIFNFRKKSGEIVKCLFSAEMITVDGEKCLLSTLDNVTDRNKFDEILRHERNLLRTLVDNLPDPISIKDKEGRFLMNNNAHLQFLGVESQEETLGKSLFDFIPEEQAKMSEEDDKSVLSTGRMILDKVEDAENKETGFSYRHLVTKIPIRNIDGNTSRLITISHDITERKRAEDALHESAEFNRSLLRTIPFGMNIIDGEGTILFQSESFRKVFGSDSTGKKCWEVYLDDNKQCPGCPLTKGITIGKTEIYEAHGLRGGRVFDIYYTGMMYQGKKAMLEIFHDITDRKQTEGDLIKSKEKAEESDRLKSAFLHNISHEIRTPMNAIIGFVTLLGETGISAEDHKSYLDIVTQSSNHLLSIVTDIIEISNIEAGKLKLNLKKTDIISLLDNLYKQFIPMASLKGLEFRYEPSASVIDDYVYTDSTKLIQILSNLLNNAFKFTKEGCIRFGFSRKGDYIEFFVADTGTGISDDQKMRIFERFYQIDSGHTRVHEGTGLGLSLSKSYIEFLGGKIWVDSETGKGSTFFVTIPC